MCSKCLKMVANKAGKPFKELLKAKFYQMERKCHVSETGLEQ